MAPIDEVSQPKLTHCVSLHDSAYDFAPGKPDPSALPLGSAGWSHEYRVKPSVLMSVGVSAIEPTEQITNTVLQTTAASSSHYSTPTQDSMITRAIEIDPGSKRFDADELLQSPASSAARTSSRVNHFASAISPSLNEKFSLGSPRA